MDSNHITLTIKLPASYKGFIGKQMHPSLDPSGNIILTKKSGVKKKTGNTKILALDYSPERFLAKNS